MPPEDAFDLLNRHLAVSHETFGRLKIYHDLLVKWQAKINLVGSDTVDDAWRRHFLDSLQLTKLIQKNSGAVLDIGTGAGFPGMVLAIYGVTDVHLVESDAKKIAFLKEVARLTQTPVTIHHARIEELDIEPPSVITARALADVTQLLDYVSPLVSHETICLFPKGKNYAMEIEDAKKTWTFDCTVHDGVTQGVILSISHSKRR